MGKEFAYLPTRLHVSFLKLLNGLQVNLVLNDHIEGF